MPIQLIVGLGNPGAEYAQTRHNAGFWFVEQLARQEGGQFRQEGKFHGEVCKIRLAGQAIWLLKPQTFMNRSGQAVAALARFYKIPPEDILVVHDELDLQPGVARIKLGGGHAGHNGLRDMARQMAGGNFLRLRIGIGHPGQARDVTGFVLGKPPQSERERIEAAMDAALSCLPQLVCGELDKAMQQLHSTQ